MELKQLPSIWKRRGRLFAPNHDWKLAMRCGAASTSRGVDRDEAAGFDSHHGMGGRCSGHSTSTAGGYLRLLTDKARAGEFSIGPMLMAAHKA
ncbi:hypothetical protein EOA37_33680, partial [Mesorhizobium sp. M2A.F.Ca.ET.015.02.1.1]